MQGRDYVLPDDVRALARSVLTHRLLPSVEAAMSGRSTGAILDGIVSAVPVPEAPTAWTTAESGASKHRA
jgi:MoxR-like ATPase